MELVVIRPGETLASAEGRYLGALDTALNDKRRIGLVLHKVLSDRRVGEAARGKCAKLALRSGGALGHRREEMKISVNVRVERPIASVWQGWNDPASIMQWNAASEDWHTDSSRLELAVGGRFCHHMAARDGSLGFDFEGTFTAVEAPTLLRYVMDDGRCVTVHFKEEAGATLITEEFDAESEHSEEMQRAGWQSILNSFKRYMESAP